MTREILYGKEINDEESRDLFEQKDVTEKSNKMTKKKTRHFHENEKILTERRDSYIDNTLKKIQS